MAAAREIAEAPVGTTQTINVEQNAAGAGTTVLYVNATSDGIAVIVAASSKNGVAATPEATFGTDAPSVERGPGGNDDVQENSTPKDPGNSAASPADTQNSSLIDEALQWLGVTAAMEILNP